MLYLYNVGYLNYFIGEKEILALPIFFTPNDETLVIKFLVSTP